MRKSQQLVRMTLEVLPPSASALLALEDLAARIKSTHEQCLASPTTGLLLARNAGEWLLQAELQLGPSEWLSWVATDCHISEKTAQTYVQIARGWPRLQPAAVDLSSVGVPQLPGKTNPIALLPQSNPDTLDVDFQTIPSSSISIPEKRLEGLALSNADIIPDSASFGDRLPYPNTKAIAQEHLTFFIPGNVVPKARPRVTANGTFLPKRYREWRNRAEVEISRQLFERSPYPTLPIQLAAIKIRLVGKHRMNADADNIVGSCLDSLVAVGVLKNDCLSYIPELSFKFVPQGTQGVYIKVLSLPI